jgi:hypothetical protein
MKQEIELNEEERVISATLLRVLRDKTRTFLADEKPNPLIKLDAASKFFSEAIREVFKDSPEASEACLYEVQFMMRRMMEWERVLAKAS